MNQTYLYNRHICLYIHIIDILSIDIFIFLFSGVYSFPTIIYFETPIFLNLASENPESDIVAHSYHSLNIYLLSVTVRCSK